MIRIQTLEDIVDETKTDAEILESVKMYKRKSDGTRLPVFSMSMGHPSKGALPMDHGARHFLQELGSEPGKAVQSAFGRNHPSHWITDKTGEETGKDGASKQTGQLYIKTHAIHKEQAAPFSAYLDHVGNVMGSKGGDPVHAEGMHAYAAAVRYHHGIHTDSDKELLSAHGFPFDGGSEGTYAFNVTKRRGTGTKKVSHDLDALLGTPVAAKAAEPGTAPEGEKKKPAKRHLFVKESAPVTTANLTESCKDVWRLSESKKTPVVAKVEESVKKDAPAKKDETPAAK